ncbi:murein biosynthesis integral membrane protein MurJ [Microbacterium betulae]|uniref:Murein biosynthesis integral membrane protein MurJ n=1 Tax=Microbacterium betulae TaxID=2981139 RepID=A0AA97FIU2_9MICO|nr:murein biosynthesis integral membrane protein MurJ [Microbacterium sp. AB]WOF23060.1 murein biosynthesis integral membrane protein MurJ [Microbacterium sp. AB]
MSSLGRSSALIAAGTLASRVTGLVRSIVLASAIGAIGQASDAFTAANQLPNNVYMVISTGILTAVIVPQIVAWSARDDGGGSHISKLMTLGAVVLVGATVVAMLLVWPLVWLYSSRFSPDQLALAVAFAYWCLPQVFFYGMFALLGETLNARRVFGPYAWAPIVNNVVSISGFLVFIAVFGGDRTALSEWQTADGAWNLPMIAALGGIATLGIVAQTAVLAFFWRRTGLSLRPDFQWRGIGLRAVGTLAGWTFLMMLVGQLVSMYQQTTISGASGDDAATTVWFNAWLVFMLPYSVIVMSIGTPYFTQISEHAAAGRDDDVRRDIGRAIRILGLLCVLAATAVMVAAVPASRLFTNQTDHAVAAAPVLVGFLIGLVPLAVQFVIQRTFYAYGDTRTPFWFTVFQGALSVGFATIAFALFRSEELLGLLTPAIAAGQSLSSLAQVILASWLLRRRLGPLGMGSSIWALVRFTLAALPAAAAGYGVYVLAGASEGWMAADKLWAVLACLLIGAVVAAVYVVVLALFRAPELKALTALARGRLGR